MPLRFEDFAVVVVARKTATGPGRRPKPSASGRRAQAGHRNNSVGRTSPCSLVWTRLPTEPSSRYPPGAPTVVEVETLGYVLLNAGPGYNGDPGWSHGRWLGPSSAVRVDADLNDPALQGQAAFAVIDHVARATCDGQVGYGLFEHASLGRHEPSGFAGWDSVAP